MVHDVFVSHSTKDKAVADAVVAGLERGDLRCWIAPRDVLPGSSYGESIVHAIGSARVMVLILSDHSNHSRHVVNEVERAVSSDAIIIPFRIDVIDPSDALALFVGSAHWLDALTPPLEEHIDRLAYSIDALLGPDVTDAAPPAPRPAAPLPATKPKTGRPLLIAGLLVAAIVIAAVGLFTSLSSGSGESATDELATTGETVSEAEPSNTTEDVAESESSTGPVADGEGDWRPLSFIVANPQLWDVSAEDRLTIVEQASADAFAWSTETVEGDLSVRFELESPGTEAIGCVIVYGDGGTVHTHGSLIFCVQWDIVFVEKHTTYHSGENYLTVTPASLAFSGEVYDVVIEVAGDTASMWVDGNKVFTTVFDPEEIKDRGQIGLYKVSLIKPEVTFSNVEVRGSSGG